MITESPAAHTDDVCVDVHDDDATDPAGPADEGAPASGLLARLTGLRVWQVRSVRAAIVAVAVLLLAADVWLAVSTSSMSSRRTAAADALNAARQDAVELLSYDHATIDQHLGDATKLLTGSFRDDFSKLAKDSVAPMVARDQATMKVDVVDAAVMTSDTASASVLLYVNTHWSTAAHPDPITQSSRMRMDLQSVDGQWLVSDLRPI